MLAARSFGSNRHAHPVQPEVGSISVIGSINDPSRHGDTTETDSDRSSPDCLVHRLLVLTETPHAPREHAQRDDTDDECMHGEHYIVESDRGLWRKQIPVGIFVPDLGGVV